MLLDSSGLFCMHHADELQSDESQTIFETTSRKLTHNYVLAELVA